jgi:hypothetical protein
LAGRAGIRQVIVHTGQLRDHALARDVLEDLGLPTPDRYAGARIADLLAQEMRPLFALAPPATRSAALIPPPHSEEHLRSPAQA